MRRFVREKCARSSRMARGNHAYSRRRAEGAGTGSRSGLVSPTAVPPVAKAIDYGQYQYEMKKKQHDAKKKQHVVQVKELKFRPNTDDHDYDFKKNHAIRFLQEGNRVKAVVQFRGREIAHTDLGRKLLLRFAEDLTRVRRGGWLAPHGRPQRAYSDQSREGCGQGTDAERKAGGKGAVRSRRSPVPRSYSAPTQA